MSTQAGPSSGNDPTTSGKPMPRFKAVLSFRSRADRRPSELEVRLRPHCEKLRVVEKLQGAHFVFPSDSNLAIRAYYPYDIERLEKLLKKKCPENKPMTDYVEKPIEHDIDDILTFASSFRFTLVLFVYSHDYMMNQLSRLDSFTNQAQRLIQDSPTTNSARILLADTTEQAILLIRQMADAYAPEKLRLKSAFAARQRAINEDPKRSLVHAMRELAKDLEISVVDIDIVTKTLGSLMAIANASDDMLAQIPIDRSTKDKLLNYFQPSRQRDTNKEATSPDVGVPALQHPPPLRPTTNLAITRVGADQYQLPTQQQATKHPANEHAPSESMDYEGPTQSALGPYHVSPPLPQMNANRRLSNPYEPPAYYLEGVLQDEYPPAPAQPTQWQTTNYAPQLPFAGYASQRPPMPQAQGAMSPMPRGRPNDVQPGRPFGAFVQQRPGYGPPEMQYPPEHQQEPAYHHAQPYPTQQQAYQHPGAYPREAYLPPTPQLHYPSAYPSSRQPQGLFPPRQQPQQPQQQGPYPPHHQPQNHWGPPPPAHAPPHPYHHYQHNPQQPPYGYR